MFGFVTANYEELTKAQKARYGEVYCGICRQIRTRFSSISRLVLSYDTAFLSLLLMSLYEPEEHPGRESCISHPFKKHDYTENEYITYAADMNVALAYHQSMDDWKDDKNLAKGAMAKLLHSHYESIRARYPRQCEAMEGCMRRLSEMEKRGEHNPDLPANCFGSLMAELFVYREDMWSDYLRRAGLALGRFIYLADAVLDWQKDRKKGSYNPFTDVLPANAEDILVMAMGRASENFEMLPLVQDKELLDNIIYSGVWVKFRNQRRNEHGG